MKFSQLSLTVDGVDVTYSPYDRGLKGAFVWRQDGMTNHQPRIIASAVIDDVASDRYTFQGNSPRLGCPDACDLPTLLGSDLIKTELRFLATTSSADRIKSLDTHIALLEEMKQTVANRETIYA